MRPLRDKNPELYRLITIRTADARLWMKPNKKVRRIIGGIIARYAEILGIELFAANFLSNHYHLLIRALGGNADEFEENVNREIARRINWINHREGKFWERRYDDQPILNEDDLLEAFLYITTNPVKHGLIRDPATWPGFNTCNMSINEKGETYSFNHYSAENVADRITHHTIVIKPLPQFAALSSKKRKEKIGQLINERTKLLIEERKANGMGFLGLEAIKEQDPNDKPISVSRSPRPHCYSKNPEVIKEHRRNVLNRRDQYTEASARYRLGDVNALFPEYSFKPPLHRKPRTQPFKPLPEDYFRKAA